MFKLQFPGPTFSVLLVLSLAWVSVLIGYNYGSELRHQERPLLSGL